MNGEEAGSPALAAESPADAVPATHVVAVDSEARVVASEGRGLLQNTFFVRLWAAQAVSQVAANAVIFGLMVVVEEATRSSAQMGLAIVTTILPSVLLAVVAGVLVDHLDKNQVLVASNLLRAGAVLGYLLYERTLVVVHLANLTTATITQFFTPAEAAKFPQVVARRDLMAATALLNLTVNGAQGAGIVLLGPLLAKAFGPSAVFLAASLAFLLAAALVLRLPAEPPPALPFSAMDKRVLVGIVWREAKAGWAFIASDHVTARAMAYVTLVATLVLVVSMLAPRFAVGLLGVRADDATVLLAPAGVGIVLGAAVMGRLDRRFGRERLMSAGLLAAGLFFTALAGARWLGDYLFGPALGLAGGTAALPAVVVAAAALGAALTLVMVPAQTVVVERAPADSRGRIFATQLALGNLASVLPLLGIGALADSLGIERVLVLLGLALVGGWAALKGRRSSLPEAAAGN